jgi:hypothetical protein
VRGVIGIAVLATVALVASFALSPTHAASPEDIYIATRDAAIAKIAAAAKAEKRGPTDGYGAAILALDEQARAKLERQMRTIVGPVDIKGMDGKAALNLDTLIEGDEDFGLLDGMVYGDLDGKTRVIVTTDSLLQRWLHQHKDWWGKDSGDIPQQAAAAVKENAFYTQAVLTDAAIMRFAELPVRKPTGAAFAYAMLAARSQSEVPATAGEIFLAVAKGRRVFVASTKEFKAVGPIPACDTIRGDLVKQASEAADAVGLDDDARQEKADALSAKAETEFLRCFTASAAQHYNYAAAADAAEALLHRLPPE